MRSILIDINKMSILKVVDGNDSVRRCEYWADILIPKSEFYICGDANRDLTPFTLLELTMLYNNATGAKLKTSTDYPRVLNLVSQTISRHEIDDTDLGVLVKKLGKPLKTPDFTPVKEKPEPKSKQSGGVPTRPKEGTMTARVWEAADWFYSQQEPKDSNSKTLRDDTVKACVENGVNQSTASTQFAKWKRHLNAT